MRPADPSLLADEVAGPQGDPSLLHRYDARLRRYLGQEALRLGQKELGDLAIVGVAREPEGLRKIFTKTSAARERVVPSSWMRVNVVQQFLIRPLEWIVLVAICEEL